MGRVMFKTLAFLSFLSFSMASNASIDKAAINEFKNGETASAEDVNSNFEIIVDAVNNLSGRVAELESSKTNSNTSSSVADKSFSLIGLINDLRSIDIGNNSSVDGNFVGTEVAVGRVLFNSDGTGLLTVPETQSATLIIGGNVVGRNGDPFEVTFTYTQSGSIINANPDASGRSNLIFSLSPFGDVLTAILTFVRTEVDQDGDSIESGTQSLWVGYEL